MKVFISYSQHDKTIVDEVYNALDGFGYDVFVDRHKIDFGEESWKHKLQSEIERSDFFLLLLSRPAMHSDWVRWEVRRAREARKRPKILPVRIDNDEQLDGELAEVVDEPQCFKWRSDADTKNLIDRTHERIAQKISRKRWFRVAVAILIVVLAAAALMTVAHRFDAEAKPLLQSSDRDEFDRGLLLAALAALMRGSDPPPEVLKEYETENYDKLLMTLRGSEALQGNALATWIDSRHLRIADGRRIWTCDLPIETGRCSVLPSLSTHVIVTSSAFKSDDEALFVGYRGEATDFSLSRGEVTIQPGRVKSVAADAGDVALGFEVSQPNDAAVVVDSKDGASPSIPGGSTQSVAFGPCSECVSVLGKDRSVKVWNIGRGTAVPLDVAEPVQAIASGRTAGRLAIIDGHDELQLYGPDLAAVPTGSTTAFPRTAGIALSADGRWIAVVHTSTVTVIEPDGSGWTLVSDNHTPRPIAAAFAGKDLIVTRTEAGVRIWRLGSAKRPHLTPYKRWLEWRKQLGVAAKDHDREARFAWNPAAREVRTFR